MFVWTGFLALRNQDMKISRIRRSPLACRKASRSRTRVRLPQEKGRRKDAKVERRVHTSIQQRRFFSVLCFHWLIVLKFFRITATEQANTLYSFQESRLLVLNSTQFDV